VHGEGVADPLALVHRDGVVARVGDRDAEDEQLLAAHAEVEQGPRASPAGAAGLVGLRQFADSLDRRRTHVVVLTS
jgi:hypothetical protein